MATVTGTSGADTIYVGFASNGVIGTATQFSDLINAGGGDDSIDAASGNDTINAGAGNDYIQVGGDNDSVNGGAGADYMDGGNDNDTLYGGTGADTMIGNIGNDLYYVDNVGDLIIEYSPDDGFDRVQSSVSYKLGQYLENLTLTGTAAINGNGNDLANLITGNDAPNIINAQLGNDTLLGKGGNDTLSGGADADNLQGGAGNDRLDGGDGADRLIGGAGADTLIGGGGNDIFEFNATSESGPGVLARDEVNGFTGVGAAVGDRIDLIDVYAGVLSFIGTAAFSAAGQVRVVASGTDTLVQVNTVGAGGAEMEILVHDGASLPSQWTAADFLL